MCTSVTVMCVGLVLLGTMGSASPSPTRDLVEDRTTCIRQCWSACRQWLGAQGPVFCCDCATLCKRSCVTPVKRESTEPINHQTSNDLPDAGSLSQTLCPSGKCDPSDPTWTILRASCGPCRTRRKLRSPVLKETAFIARSVGLDLGGLGAESYLQDANVADGDLRSLPTEEQMSRNLRLVSLSKGQEVVTAVVAWDHSTRTPWSLVSWEPEDGGLKGNLLTNMTSASISLGPDIVYHLQVSDMNSGETSECLLVDTHSSPSSQPLLTTAGLEVVAGASAALLVFLAAVLIFAARYRLRSSKVNDRLPNHYHFKVFPPPITLTPTDPPSLAQLAV